MFFAHDVPVSDDWDIVPLLQKQAAQTLNWQDLWEPYAEHRIPFGRLGTLSQARLTDWNLPLHCFVNVLMCAAIVVPIGYILRQLARENGDLRLSRFLLIASAWIILSLNGWIDYFWAWQFTLLLSILAFVTGIALLSPLTFGRAAIAILCGIISTGSYGNGLLFWLLAPLIILVGRPLDLRRVGAAAAFALIGIVVIGTAMSGVPAPAGAKSEILQHLGLLTLYVLNFLGTPLAPPAYFLAVAAGAVGVLLFLGLGLLLYRHRTPALVQFAALGAYAILSAGAAGVGRMHLGFAQGSDARYYHIAMMLWIANLVLLHRALRLHPRQMKVGAPAILALAAIMVFSIGRSAPQWRNIQDYSEVQVKAREALLSGEDDDALQAIATERVPVAEMRVRDQVLRKLEMSLHRRD